MSTKRLNEVELSQKEVSVAAKAVADALVQFEDAQRSQLQAMRNSLAEYLDKSFSVGSE